MASAPYLGGGFGHFYAYAPEKFEYPIDRFSMEVKRQLDVLDKQLSNKNFICCNQYTIADIAIWPWYGALILGRLYSAGDFLDVTSYKNILRWANKIDNRPAIKRGRMVNRITGKLESQLYERHDAEDFLKSTQDKIIK
jgi:GST-like protein